MAHTPILVRAALCIHPDQHESLRRLSQETGASISELARRAIGEFLELAQHRGETGLPRVDSLLR